MANKEKKIRKIKERIADLEAEVYTNLKQKTSSTSEINIAKYQNEINRLRIELAKLS